MNEITKNKISKGFEQILKVIRKIKENPIENTNQDVLDKITKISTKIEMDIIKDMNDTKR